MANFQILNLNVAKLFSVLKNQLNMINLLKSSKFKLFELNMILRMRVEMGYRDEGIPKLVTAVG